MLRYKERDASCAAVMADLGMPVNNKTSLKAAASMSKITAVTDSGQEFDFPGCIVPNEAQQTFKQYGKCTYLHQNVETDHYDKAYRFLPTGKQDISPKGCYFYNHKSYYPEMVDTMGGILDYDNQKILYNLRQELKRIQDECAALDQLIDQENQTLQAVNIEYQNFKCPPKGMVIFYQNCDESGWSVGLDPGRYTLDALKAKGFVNDDASYVKFNAPCKVTLFEHDHFQGTAVDVTQDTCLYSFNDTVSSIIVDNTPEKNIVQIYQHCDPPSGWSVTLPVGRFTLSELQKRGFVNDDASYVRFINPGKVTIYEHDNFEGRHVTVTNDLCLYDFNDVASSIVVEEFNPNKDTLFENERLNPDEKLVSQSGRFTFIMQSDGNAVIYQGSQPIWASQTYGSVGSIITMQSDGNLVVYQQSQPIWSSQTWTTTPRGRYRLVMQDDGNLVIYDGTNVPTWASNTQR
jgi:hypothetical protein